MKNNLTANNTIFTVGDDGLPSGVYASFETTDTAGKKALYNALNGDCASIADNVGKEIVISDVVVARSQTTDDNGEVKDSARTILIGPDGNRYASSSFGVLRSIIGLCQAFGSLHFDEPLTIIPIDVKTKKGHTFKLNIK